jgi:NADH dehydrogenase/NADH:ubiquinone oxidoreductase subunit G
MSVSLTIDGRRVEAPEGAMLLEVCRSLGLDIPALCAHDALEPWGGCRLCVVEITRPSWDGWRKLVTSCLYPVEEDLIVFTVSDRITEVRRTVLDLLLARAPASEEIRELACRYGVLQTSFHEVPEADRCILCGLCYRICDHLGISAISSASRGFEKYVGTPFGEVSQACIGCLSCVHICPTRNLEFEEDGDVRRIWNREFRLVRCESCGRAHLTEEQVEFHMKLSGLPRDYFATCDVCKRGAVAETLKAVARWDSEEEGR